MTIRRLINFYIDSMLSLFITLSLLKGMQSFNIDLSEYYELQIIVQLTYYLLMEGFTGRTIGKFITRTKVIHEEKATGNKILYIFIRTFCRLIPFEPLSVFIKDNKVMWHDRLSKTKVVKIGSTI